jgi:putative transposase
LTLADRTWNCDCGAVLDRDQNAALNIERQALNILRGSGFTEQVKNGRGQDVRPFGAILSEASKMAEERRPSILAVI